MSTFYISLSLLSPLSQDYQRQMQKLDGEIEEVNGWIDGAEKKMNEMDGQGPNDTVLKVVMFIFVQVVFNLYLCGGFFSYFSFTNSLILFVD